MVITRRYKHLKNYFLNPEAAHNSETISKYIVVTAVAAVKYIFHVMS